MTLTAVYPWSGRLWSEDAPITIGHATKCTSEWEGWFNWEPLVPGSNEFSQKNGLGWDAPYFALHNESTGEYFFGQLAWPVSYVIELRKENGLTFKIGPWAANTLRVIAAGESIITPTVHLGYVKEDFDSMVQAMHDHIRRSVSTFIF